MRLRNAYGREHGQPALCSQVMRDLIDQGYFKFLHVVPRFTRVPIIEGVRGWDNGSNLSVARGLGFGFE